MELGEKLRQARLEAGLSQRQLCGETITRNMLSQIENGSAKPSMATLCCLAGRLGFPVSYFLEEDTLRSPNIRRMEEARAAWEKDDQETLWSILEEFQLPDQVYQCEHALLRALCLLRRGEMAMQQYREAYARELLDKAEASIDALPYCREELHRRRLLLLGLLKGQKAAPLAAKLPSMDAELLLRARAALEARDWDACAGLLDTAQDKTAPRWGLLRGRVHLIRKEYTQAAKCFHLAEEEFPRETAAPLEQCYRELGNYRLAYTYACNQRSYLAGIMNEP